MGEIVMKMKKTRFFVQVKKGETLMNIEVRRNFQKESFFF